MALQSFLDKGAAGVWWLAAGLPTQAFAQVYNRPKWGERAMWSSECNESGLATPGNRKASQSFCSKTE
jgi:hypothetical protein